MKGWDDKTTLIGDLLCKFVRASFFSSHHELVSAGLTSSSLVSRQLPYLKSYIVYARMNEKAQELLMTVETKPAFTEFVKSWERANEVYLSLFPPPTVRPSPGRPALASCNYAPLNT